MIMFFKKIKFIVSNFRYIDKMIKNEPLSKEKNLRLCYEHRQEENGSHYASNNCDYCKLLKKTENRLDQNDYES